MLAWSQTDTFFSVVAAFNLLIVMALAWALRKLVEMGEDLARVNEHLKSLNHERG